MLHIETVEPGTFTLLKEILALSEMRDFALVGGTALSLKFGHRISEDLDIFSNVKFENDKIENALNHYFKTSFDNRTSTPRFGIFCFIRGVKVDIIRYGHPLIRPIEVLDGIRFFSDEDIIAMKVQAILGRARKKDFWDIAELLKHYSVADFIRFHKEKFSTQHLLITVPQAISYFEEAEDDEDPVSLKDQSWESVKVFIRKKVSEFLE